MSTGIGAPSTAIAVEELAQIGVQTLIRVGSAGAYQSEIALGDLLVAQGIVRDDGLSAVYLPQEVPALPSRRLFSLAQKLAPQAYFGLVRSHDGFYMDDNAEREEKWSSYGVLGADMESGMLMTLGQVRGLDTLSILNNVVLWQEDVKEGINNLVNSEDLVKRGEKASLQLALDILGKEK